MTVFYDGQELERMRLSYSFTPQDEESADTDNWGVYVGDDGDWMWLADCKDRETAEQVCMSLQVSGQGTITKERLIDKARLLRAEAAVLERQAELLGGLQCR
jgi:hypothetical protein